MGEELIANEMAPRVHNTGHWTIEGAHTSQFENHCRAITGLPLGITHGRGPCAMVNCLGRLPSLPTLSAIPYTHFHDYKKKPKPHRKVGHITLCTPDENLLNQYFPQVMELTSHS